MLLKRLLLILAIVIAQPTTADAQALNKWKISCGVDKGAIVKKGKTWTFRTSSNHCVGGTFNQRAELTSDRVKPNHKGSYRFQSFVSITSSKTERFDIFQIHDGRNGCAPPLKLEVQPNGQLTLTGDYKIGDEPGENCVRDIVSSSGGSKARFKRDGTEQKLDVIVSFTGDSGFDVFVLVDDAQQLSGSYRYSADKGYFRSKYFYFKHGVYSKNPFPYTLVSRNMKVKRVKLSN